MPKPSSKTATPAPEASPVAGFEHALQELEALVTQMEGGELSLDESLHAFERGTALYRTCRSALEQAEVRVKLVQDPQHPETGLPFAPDAEA